MSIGIIDNGNEFTQHYGNTDLNKRYIVSDSTMFHLASISKLFRSADKPFSTWYQVRNNMVHAGKDGYEDLETIIGATVGMMKVLPETILLVVPEFKEKWRTLQKNR